MCKRCEAINRELVTFQRLGATIEDNFTLALIAEAIKDLQSERATLHLDDEAESRE